MNAKERSFEGVLMAATYENRFKDDNPGYTGPPFKRDPSFSADTTMLFLGSKSPGKELILDRPNELKQSYGVRSHSNFRRFIDTISVSVLPVLKSENVDIEYITHFMKYISYEQALAFYNWKYPVHSSKQTDEWQQFVFPTKEQFRKVQNGEKVFVPERRIAFPTPVFRYVVLVYRNRD